MPRRILTVCLLVLAATALLAQAPAASAAKRKSATAPKVTFVAPMRVRVGALLTIKGQRFSSKRRKNTVIFRAGNGRSAFAKPLRASRTKLVVRVPPSVARLLTIRNSSQRPTRLRLRVLAGRFSAFTPRRLSPVVVGADADDDGTTTPPAVVCDRDSDHDDDLLSNSLEKDLKTDPCLADTDDDGIVDGWEYYAAKDLNLKATPYPGKRPYPNPLDPSDDVIDFDGDGLRANEEYRAWRRSGSSFVAGMGSGLDLGSPLGYSDGTKFSRNGETPSIPNWRGPAHGVPAPPATFPAAYNLHGDAAWRDDERDADADGLANFLEAARGPSRNSWWKAYWENHVPPVDPWKEGPYYGYFEERPFADLDLADADVDGDTLLDGEDDQDNDDYSNVVELYEVVYDLDGDGNVSYPTVSIGGASFVINGFNPCAPDEDARTCPDYRPF